MDTHSSLSFKRLQRLKSDFYTGLISKYESDKTGLQVVIVDAKGPKLEGYFALATEIHDDSGAPHTLEHLIFMGSKSYRYKGFLSKLANRDYAFINAWTDVDHTAYTLSTAGSEGFVQMLPVYLEHILLPTLRDSACYTEVHHVDGTGHDAGVVYSEMQSFQNTASELIQLRLKRLIYPKNVGFRQETGGMMPELRKLSADRIREFHRQMYQPRNLCLIIIGEVDHESLFSALESFDAGISDRFPLSADWKRPWTENGKAPPLQSSFVETVEFPEEDESLGEIAIAFLGPDCGDRTNITALEILLYYLAGSSISVLETALVDNEQLVSEITYGTDERPDTLIQFKLGGIETEKLAAVEKRFFDLLESTASSPLDMTYLRACIEREKLQLKLWAEDSPQMANAELISDFVYGERDGSSLSERFSLKRYDAVAMWDDKQWRSFFRRWLLDAHHVSILGVPSAAMSEKLKEEEKARINKRIEKLGPQGLKKLEKKLEEAKAMNDVEIPRELLEKFPIPSAESIHFIETTTARSGAARTLGVPMNGAQKRIDQDLPDLPVFIQFEDVSTKFVHITLLLSTEQVPVEKRPLLAMYIENFFKTPILRDGEPVPFENIVMELEKDTISHFITTGEGFQNAEVLRIDFRVEPAKYETTLGLLRELLWSSIFDEERISATVAKMLASIPEEKRDGNSMVSAVDTIVNFNPESISRAQCALVRHPYLKQLKKMLQENPQAVLATLEEIRGCLCRFANMRLLVIADLKNLRNPVTAWKLFSERLGSDHRLGPLGSPSERLSDAGRMPGGNAYLIPMSTIDTSNSLLTTKGPDSPMHPRLPALLVAVAYLDADEGPMCNAIRGAGLGYGSRFGTDLSSGHLTLLIYMSPDVSHAFAAGKKVVDDLVSGSTQLDSADLEAAVSEIIFGFASKEYSMNRAGRTSFVNQVILGVSKEYNGQLLKEVRQVTTDQVRTVLKEVILPVFSPETSNLVITCATVEVERVKGGFDKLGFNVDVRSLSSFHDDYGLGGDDGGSGDDDDEDEDDDHADESED